MRSSSNWNLAGYNSGQLSFSLCKGPDSPGMTPSTLTFPFLLGCRHDVRWSSSYRDHEVTDMGYKLCTSVSNRRHKQSDKVLHGHPATMMLN